MQKENNLVRMRKKKGLSQREAAAALNVSRQAVSQWERGVTAPSSKKLIFLSQLYETTVEALCVESAAEESEPEGGTGEPAGGE